jgi:acetyltransferase-like isoleucine patch superfamily enzyme
MTIHPTADVSPRATIGPNTHIWHQAQVREGAVIGANCILGKGVYVDLNVSIGDNVKVQNGAMLYHGATIEAGVFIGPGVILTNDKLPRAITPDGALKSDADWTVGPIRIGYGASLGAGAVILPDVTIGRFALVAAGAEVTRSVPDHTLVVGSPARAAGLVCRCARRLEPKGNAWYCSACDWTYQP